MGRSRKAGGVMAKRTFHTRAGSLKIAEIIGIAREAKGWSQLDLAREACVAPSSLCRLEQGKMPDPSFITIARIFEALGVSLDRAAEAFSVKRLRAVLRSTPAGRAALTEGEKS